MPRVIAIENKENCDNGDRNALFFHPHVFHRKTPSLVARTPLAPARHRIPPSSASSAYPTAAPKLDDKQWTPQFRSGFTLPPLPPPPPLRKIYHRTLDNCRVAQWIAPPMHPPSDPQAHVQNNQRPTDSQHLPYQPKNKRGKRSETEAELHEYNIKTLATEPPRPKVLGEREEQERGRRKKG